MIAVSAALVAVLAGMVLAIAGAHVTPSGGGGSHRQVVRPGATVVVPPTRTATPPPSRRPRPGAGTVGAVVFAAGALAVLAGLIIAVRLALVALRVVRLPRRSRAPVATGGERAPDDLARQMADVVADALAELDAGGPVSDSIIACWQRLGDAAVAAGIARVPSDSPEEAIGRVFSAGRVREAPLRALAELYREARFSRHRMGAADAAAARTALTDVLADLQEPTHA